MAQNDKIVLANASEQDYETVNNLTNGAVTIEIALIIPIVANDIFS